MSRFTVYSLSDPRTGKVRYVGCTVNLNNRYRAHCRPRYHSKLHCMWIASLLTDGLKPTLSILAVCGCREVARATEHFWTRHMIERGEDLTNHGPRGIASEHPTPARKVRYLTRKGCMPGMRVPA